MNNELRISKSRSAPLLAFRNSSAKTKQEQRQAKRPTIKHACIKSNKLVNLGKSDVDFNKIAAAIRKRRHQTSELSLKVNKMLSGHSSHKKQLSKNHIRKEEENSEKRTTEKPNCTICLSEMINRSLLYPCLHEFCLDCIRESNKTDTNCPICRGAFQKIIYNVRYGIIFDEIAANQTTEPEVQFDGRDIVAQGVEEFGDIESRMMELEGDLHDLDIGMDHLTAETLDFDEGENEKLKKDDSDRGKVRN